MFIGHKTVNIRAEYSPINSSFIYVFALNIYFDLHSVFSGLEMSADKGRYL
jgi:hypothetical protein